MSNPQSELFKELSNNSIFNNYLNQLDGSNDDQILQLAMSDEELMQKLKSILDDENIIKVKMSIKINMVNKSKKPIYKEEEEFVPYYKDGNAYLSKDIKIIREGFNLKLITPTFTLTY